MQNTQYTIHSTQYTIHNTWYTVLHSAHYTLLHSQYAEHNTQCTVCNTLHSTRYTKSNTQYTMNRVAAAHASYGLTVHINGLPPDMDRLNRVTVARTLSRLTDVPYKWTSSRNGLTDGPYIYWHFSRTGLTDGPYLRRFSPETNRLTVNI